MTARERCLDRWIYSLFRQSLCTCGAWTGELTAAGLLLIAFDAIAAAVGASFVVAAGVVLVTEGRIDLANTEHHSPMTVCVNVMRVLMLQ